MLSFGKTISERENLQYGAKAITAGWPVTKLGPARAGRRAAPRSVAQ